MQEPCTNSAPVRVSNSHVIWSNYDTPIDASSHGV